MSSTRSPASPSPTSTRPSHVLVAGYVGQVETASLGGGGVRVLAEGLAGGGGCRDGLLLEPEPPPVTRFVAEAVGGGKGPDRLRPALRLRCGRGEAFERVDRKGPVALFEGKRRLSCRRFRSPVPAASTAASTA